jgi:[histone H3]-dimethyl-L-lysine9 demethylase
MYHTFPDFTPISRFAPGEVKQLILEIEMLPNIPPSRPFAVTPAIAAAMTRADCDRKVISIQHNELTNELFDHLWDRADPYPLVVTPIPGQKLLQYPWSPEFFANITGTTECKAQDCETGEIVQTTVGGFYGLFGKNFDRILRLKVSCYFAISLCAFGLNKFSPGLSFIRALPEYPPILPSSS